MSELQKQIDEIKGLGLAIDQIDAKYKQELNSLKEELRLEKDMRITNTKTMNRFLNDWCNRVKNIKEVLQGHLRGLNTHELLEKLDAPQTEKKDCKECKNYKGFHSSWCEGKGLKCVNQSKFKPKDSKKEVCSLKEQNDCNEYGSLDCLSGNSEGFKALRQVCIHGKKELKEASGGVDKPDDSTHTLVQCPKCNHKYLINKEDINVN